MDAVSTIVALDVPWLALLVIESAASVKNTVSALRSRGVDAESFDLRVMQALLDYRHPEAARDPKLLVCTASTIRGVDIPGLTHIFIHGLPEGGRGNADTYLHLSGRVGRSGQPGRVITLVEASEEDMETGREAQDANAMKDILLRVSVQPVRLPEFR